MTMQYHEGELAVQARAGVQIAASRIGRSIGSTIPPIAQAFLLDRQMVIVSSVDAQGRVWTSLLTGEAGFIRALDEQTIKISTLPLPDDPLAKNMQNGSAIGLLAIDLATRRRMRVNGRIDEVRGSILVHTQQVYANCRQYIQLRSLQAEQREAKPSGVMHARQLTDEQRQWIEQADTFFIGSYHRDGGADASHRGGMPGFVHIEDPTHLVFPDYSGNRMFQTLGNISANPHAGLLFVDFRNGNILQLTGRAHVNWEKERAAAFMGAERVVEYDIDEVLEMVGVHSLHGELVEYSPALSPENLLDSMSE